MIEFLNKLYFFNLLTDVSPFFSDVLAVLGSICAGLAIGWDREQSGKAAGFRTFALVCLGSTLFTLIARELNTPDSVARIVGQVVSGIGFIGAGAVFRDKSRVSGLTTAAGIWVCSAIGVIFGLGYLPFGILISFFVFVLFRLQRKAEQLIFGKCELKTVCISFKENGNLNSAKIISALGDNQRLNLRRVASAESTMTQFKLDCCSNHKSHREFLGDLANLDFIESIFPAIEPISNQQKWKMQS